MIKNEAINCTKKWINKQEYLVIKLVDYFCQKTEGSNDECVQYATLTSQLTYPETEL
jgi:hypothetical protein